jgi:DNA-binding MarR family transcriptional regulator
MKLEDEIKNSKPIPLRQRTLLNILFTASWLDTLLSRRLKKYGITHQQYNVLRILNGSVPQGLTVIDIKSRMVDRASNVSRLVEKLRLQNLIERVVHCDDRRKVSVTITPNGVQMLANIADDRHMSEETAPGMNLDAQEAEELNRLLEKFRE